MGVSFSFSEIQSPQAYRSAGKRREGTDYCNVSKTRVRGSEVFFPILESLHKEYFWEVSSI